ncbi:DUF305 domain-containing protein [Limnobacter humi]|uniref:DUF305 domain-containing protein n=1 Tax=Limnobacter humi TaxID=1778671 RepID=A0ABT1WFL7_9BURK|nr:DUF305 domain-containing protein [Limnobacter humi]MCQ8896311.1 DUF305 domain-containing protein [Limnobacter humi]
MMSNSMGSPLPIDTRPTRGRLPGGLAALLMLVLLSAGFAGYRLLGLAPTTHQSAAVPSVVDTGFAQSMIQHHSQAITMAMAVQDNPNPAVRGLARSILLAQMREIGLMEGWLSAWGAAPVPMGPAMAWVDTVKTFKTVDDELFATLCRSQGGNMPGLASPEDLQQLRSSTGTVQEKLFLTLMIAHHRSAVSMANFAWRYASTDLIKGFAKTVARDQLTEIDWMQRQLQAMTKP